MGANEPSWAGGASVPSGLIAMWHGTIANIPSGWLICDGNNSTPNLLTKFVQGVATAATDPGATGGAATHTHGTVGTAISDFSGSTGYVGYHDANPFVTGAGDSHPPFYDVAFLMKS